jgi:glutamine synthetase
MVEAIPALTTEKTIRMYERFGVFNETELRSREEIKYENYSKVVNIEAKTMIDMAGKQIIPAVIRYTKELADTVLAVRGAGCEASVQSEMLARCSQLLLESRNALEELKQVEMRGAAMEEGKEKALYFHDEVAPAMERLRKPVDELELIVDKEIWPMPSYGDLIFEV